MRNVIIVLTLVLAAFLVMDFNGRMSELKRLEAERDIVQEHLDNRLETEAALQAEIDYANSDAAVYKWAYENHMVRDGDNRVVPIQVAVETPAPTARPQVTPTEMSNYERWLSLFVDLYDKAP
jgi:hypothetical protein